MKDMGFLHAIFTQGRPESASRFLMFLHAAFAIGWVTHFVVHWHALPDFSGLTMFVAAPYAINKAPDIAGAIRGGVAPGAAVAVAIADPQPAAPANPSTGG